MGWGRERKGGERRGREGQERGRINVSRKRRSERGGLLLLLRLLLTNRCPLNIEGAHKPTPPSPDPHIDLSCHLLERPVWLPCQVTARGFCAPRCQSLVDRFDNDNFFLSSFIVDKALTITYRHIGIHKFCPDIPRYCVTITWLLLSGYRYRETVLVTVNKTWSYSTCVRYSL